MFVAFITKYVDLVCTPLYKKTCLIRQLVMMSRGFSCCQGCTKHVLLDTQYMMPRCFYYCQGCEVAAALSYLFLAPYLPGQLFTPHLNPIAPQ